MANNNVKAEDIFGGPSDFQGFGTGGDGCGAVPTMAEGRTPHWHDSAFTGNEVKVEAVTEEELCSHF